VVVGVNRFIADDGGRVPVMRIDPELERSQVERLQRWRSARGPVDGPLATVEDTARSEANLLPCLREALQAGATIGEVSDVLRRVFGTYR
jgi:methylmalonyl-CoA mutase N-terminal domain/subunit